MGHCSDGPGIVKIFQHKKISFPGSRLPSVLNLGLLLLAGHQGGPIAHGKESQTQGEMMVYPDLIHPVLEQNCMSCHNPDDRKGEFNMETYQSLLKGGDMGYAIAPSDREDSELYYRITLHHEHEDFMPAEGRPPLHEGEVALLGWWIDQGASPDAVVSDYPELPPSMESYIAQAFHSMLSEEEREKRERERRELYARLNQIQVATGILIIPTEPRSLEFNLETYAIQKRFDHTTLNQLQPFASRFVRADLSGTQLTDEAIPILSEFKNLQSLNLSKTRIEGRNIDQLSALLNLRSLNLYGTPIRSDYLDSLTELKQLKRLFLFQTELYDETLIAQLKEALPDCDFVMN